MGRTAKKEISGLRERRWKRRLEAARLFELGQSRAEVSQSLGISWKSAHLWYLAWAEAGKAGLATKGKPGPQPKFNTEAKEQLESLLRQGPVAFGYANHLWTLSRIARVSKEKLGIDANQVDVWRVLRSMKWSSQKPKRRARERNEERIKRWREQEWPRISEQAAKEGRTIVHVDESGLSQRPARKSTWAPEGETPVLEFNFNWKKLSVIAGVTLRSVYFELHEQSIKSEQVVAFLKQLQELIRRPITIVWDGLRAHWSKQVKTWVEQQDGRIILEQLPPYAPELNAVEYLWAHIKQHELANLCPKDLVELSTEAKKALFKAKRNRACIKACWIQTELPLSA